MGLFLVGAMVCLAAFAPYITDQSPLAQDLQHPFAGLSLAHPFGTDAFGRDTATRVIYGARYSLLEAVGSITLACVIGTGVGLLSSFAGDRGGGLMMASMDVLFAFPGVVLALLMVSLLGAGFFTILVSITLFSVPVYARLARNLSAELRQAPFVEAAVALGVKPIAVAMQHVLPSMAAPILVQCAASAGSVILTAASLSFLGLGVQPPAPEWGAMMSDGRNYVGAFFLPSLFPGVAITLLILGFNLLAEGLRSRSADA